jgi:hypothetical protein
MQGVHNSTVYIGSNLYKYVFESFGHIRQF